MKSAIIIFLYILFFAAVISGSDLSNQAIAFEDAKIISKEILDDQDDLQVEDTNANGGNSTSTGSEKSVTVNGEEEPPEYEDSDAEPESMDESVEGSDAQQAKAKKVGDVTIKDEVMRHDDTKTSTQTDTKQDSKAKIEVEKNPEKGKSPDETQTNLPSCADDQIMKLMKELRTINPEGAVVRAIETENRRLCRKLSSGLSTAEHFMTTCDVTKGEKIYSQLIHGVRLLNSKVCQEEIFRSEYLKYVSCYRGIGEDYMDCVGPAGWSEGNKEDDVCSEYVKVANCFYIKTAVRCSLHEARIVKDLVREVVGSVLSVQCKDAEKEPDVSGLVNGAKSKTRYPQGLTQIVFTLWSIGNVLSFHGGSKPSERILL
ncbi:uncharacterized protein LOC124160729 [Ischnura elegans]|uniref:uncharacterized protein LOC124160729 n=1 Tax=Ischnura elegans TaxID=197161 RepID=UPI001ED890DE|nr:uncharacterized protein LOC124160729 [Ischnura elegans]XP_046392687.1 uncharacterized protein LOC124160729 [Ischnura elegans]